jgi:hypothetical protein
MRCGVGVGRHALSFPSGPDGVCKAAGRVGTRRVKECNRLLTIVIAKAGDERSKPNFLPAAPGARLGVIIGCALTE